MKQCNKCNKQKNETEFKKDPRNSSGLQGICKECNKAWQRSRRELRGSGAIDLPAITDKKCNRCLETKTVDLFYKDTGCADGYSTLCKVCRNQSMSKWRTNNKERYNAVMRKRRAENKEETKRIDLKRTYGISLENYNQMLQSQKQVCAICAKPQLGVRPLAVDHCHKTDLVRELLCYSCNRLIVVLDNHPLYQACLDYLAKHKKPA